MNARDKFIDVLRSRGMLRPGEEWVVDANLAAHAHELAEQQRAHADAMECYNGALYDGGQLHSLPDLIDPKAQRASTEGDTP